MQTSVKFKTLPRALAATTALLRAGVRVVVGVVGVVGVLVVVGVAVVDVGGTGVGAATTVSPIAEPQPEAAGALPPSPP